VHNRLVRSGGLQEKGNRRLIVQVALLAAAYFVAAKLALLLAVPPGYATALWPPSGIALAAVLMLGPRVWPGVFIGSALANLHIEGAVLASVVIASASSAQALVAGSLLRRHVGVPYRFVSVRQVVIFVLLCAGAAVIAPTVALLPLAAAHEMPAQDLFWNWWTWWQGDASGMLVVAPLVLSWAAPDTIAWSRRRILEGLAFWVLLLLATDLVFRGGFGDVHPYATTFVLVPLVVWAAFRFHQRGVTTATAAVCGIALWYTLVHYSGPFSSQPLHEALVLLLAFISTLVVTGLVLSAVLGQLDAAMAQLEARVRERTAALETANALLQEDIVARTRTEQMLAQSERRFRLMVDSVVDYAIFRLDSEGRVASWNAGAQRITGYEAEEIIGENFARFYPAEEAARGRPEAELQAATDEGRCEEEGWRLRKDGSAYWASVVLTALREEDGRLVGYTKVVRDLTERNRAEAELIRAKVAAEKASEAKSQFLANMSHELRTPLNSLLILARLLSDNVGGNLTPKQVQFARTIYASGMDLLTLINDLLDLARIESGAVAALSIAPAPLADLCEELERTFRQLAVDKGLRFAIERDPALPEAILTDAARLKQVLKNLLANAFKFTREGAVSLRIAPVTGGWSAGQAHLETAPAVLAFSVVDTGIGIPHDKQKIIFEAFQQADGTTSRQYGGTGLGLSISRELTRLLGGEIRVSSAPGRGSTFTLYLPAPKAPDRAP
jgi:PAS domain S-box-containing protein